MGFFRPTYAEIDLDALEHNLNEAKKHVSKNVGVMAMVKGDAYGHGAVQVSSKLAKCGVASLGVATVEEGLELRESGIHIPIVVMGGLMGMGSPACGMMVGADLTPVIHSAGVVGALESVCKSAGKVINVHLKVDSGMTRLGVLPKDLDRVLEELKSCKHIKLEGVMTHFAMAEDPDYTLFQEKVFDEAVQKIKKAFKDVKVWHAANSAALIDEREFETDSSTLWVRPGLMLYGAYPTLDYREKVNLKPVMTIKSSIALIKTVPEGTKVSYNCTYTTDKKTRLGVIPIGYADGYPWSLSNKGVLLVNGKRVPVVGRVTMDMIIVNLNDVEAKVGDKVVLLGKQGKDEITINEIADLAGTITYEFFSGISKRMPRFYI